MYFRSTLIAAALTIAAFSGVANAEQTDDPAEISALASVTVSATDAIAAAEKAGNGKVVELTLEASGAPHYAITLQAADGTETNYVVDAMTGAAVQVGEASADNGDGDGETMDDVANANDQRDGDGETMDDGPNANDQGDGDGETNDDANGNANDTGDGDGESPNK